MFVTGQKIVCINDSGFPRYLMPGWYVAFPEKGKIYTVRDLVLAGKTKKELESFEPNELAVLLKEIENPVNKQGIENGYNAERFRALEEQELPPKEVAVEEELELVEV